jgi:hypothetical protein
LAETEKSETMMDARTAVRVWMLSTCVICWGCQSKAGRDKSAPFKIIATDDGFEAPDVVPAGLRHIVFENRGSEIHEAMLVKLPDGMSPKDYVAVVKTAHFFPRALRIIPGPD